jgi:hypothetical protein
MKYTIPISLLPVLNDLNRSLNKYAGASGTDDANFAILDFPDEWLPDYQNFITTYSLQPFGIYNEVRQGTLLVRELIQSFKELGLSLSDTAQLFNTITPVITVAQSGALNEAKFIANNIPTTAQYTNARKTWLVNKIQEYIDNLQ